MPFMDFNLYYDWLYQVEGDDMRVIVPVGESGRYEPMAGIYKPSIAPLLQTTLAGEGCIFAACIRYCRTCGNH